MKLTKIGLISKIAILVGIVEFIAFSSMGFLYSEKYSSQIGKDIRTRLHLINKMIANEEMPISSLSRTKYMSNMIGEPYLEGMVIGSNGFIIVSSKPEYLGKKLKTIQSFNQEWILNKVGEKFIQNDKKLTSVAYLADATNLTPLYQTIITINTDKLNLIQNRIIVFGMIGSLIFVILSTIVIILFAQRFVTQRINNSLKVLQQVEKGDLKASIPISQLDELGRLQKGINSMIQKVATLLFEYKMSTKELQTAQQKTLEQKEEFESIFNYSQDSIAIIDLDSNFLKCNTAFINFTGYSQEELLLLKYESITSPDDKLSNQKTINMVIQDGFIRNIEKKYVMKHGKFVNVLISMSLLPDKKRILLSIKDITATKMLESQSRFAAMGEMIGNIAHQWRQPLNALSITIQKVQRFYSIGKLDEETMDKSIDKSMQLIQKMSTTIDDFMGFFREDKLKISFDVVTAIEETLTLVEASLKNNFINLEFDKPNESKNIEGYKGEFTQVILNIISNAKDALIENKISSPQITIHVENDENTLKIEIIDNAGGIPDDIIGYIFNPYFTTKEEGKGTGIGLYMSKIIIEQNMEGKLFVTNTEDGACFTILITI